MVPALVVALMGAAAQYFAAYAPISDSAANPASRMAGG
jgi:hypothetical protein